MLAGRARTHLAPILVLCVLLAPSIHASEVGDVTAARLVDRSSGPAQGGLVLLAVEDFASLTPTVPGSLPDPRPDAGFLVAADRLVVVDDHTDRRANGFYLEANPVPVHDGPGSLEGLHVRALHHLWVTPLDPEHPVRVHVQDEDCSTLESASKPERSLDARIRGERSTTVPLADAVAWTGCGHSTVTVRGDFAVSLWEWDVRLTDANGTTPLVTGQQDAAPGNATGRTAGPADELFVQVHNGTLSMDLVGGTYELYLGRPSLHSRVLELEDAFGTVPGVDGPVDGDVSLEGDLTASVASVGVGRPLRVHLQGRPDQAMLDGEPLALAPSPPGSGWTAPVGMLLPVLASALVLVVGLCWIFVPMALHARLGRPPLPRTASLRERRAHVWSGLAGEALAAERFRTALVLTWLARWSRPSPAHHELRAEAQTGLGRFVSSMRTRERLDRLLDDARERTQNAWKAFLLAVDHAPWDAASWLGRAGKYHPLSFLSLAESWTPPDDETARSVAWEVQQAMGNVAYQ